MVDQAKDTVLVFFTFSYTCREVVVDCAQDQLLVSLYCNQAKILVVLKNYTRIPLSIKEHSIREYKLTALHQRRIRWQQLFHQPQKLPFSRQLNFVLSNKIINVMDFKSFLRFSYFSEANVTR